MTQDIRQWLAEIKGLQQKLVELQQERDQAYISAANWRNLYETEAKQRRNETQTAQQTISDLQAKLAALQRPSPTVTEYGAIVRQQVERWQTVEELQRQLMQSLLETDRLTQQLAAEQQAHLQTRQDLTTALGDTMDLLTQLRRRQERSHATVIPLRREAEPDSEPCSMPLAKPQSAPVQIAEPPAESSKAPSHEPRLPDPAQSPS